MIDGFDLDFMRFIVYFKLGEGRKNARLMTQLVKDIRSKIDEVSARRGKKILLSARVPPTIDACLEKGLDIQEWIRLGLIDFVSIGIHWKGDPSLPVAKFIKDLGFHTIPVYASIDDGGYNQREPFSHGMFRGMASHILSQGADGIYLFNQYYGQFLSEYNGKLHLEKGNQVCRVMMPQLLNELGSQETLINRNKIYCLCDSSVEYGIKPVSHLPLTVGQGKVSAASIFIGDNPQKIVPQEAILFLRLNIPSEFELHVNGIKVTNEKPEYVDLYDKSRGLTNSDHEYAFILPASSLNQGNNQISFKSKNGAIFKVKRMEVALKYGDVETYGYF
jgi:hypothetical protein